MKTAAIVLAVDDSPGFPGPKYLSQFRGTTLIEAVVAEVHGWPVDTVLVVLGAAADEILKQTDLGDSLIVIDLEPDGGAAAGLRIGIDTLYRLDEYDTAILMHADQPGSSADEVARMLEQHRAGHRPAVVPKYRYSTGHPVVVGEVIWPRLISTEGTTSFDRVLQAHPDWLEEVWFDRLPPRRVSSPDDLEDLPKVR
ncbi:MAG: NTP transferase domain-containing protein [Acidimicrobiia bacterium]|nr:NTP transferase domain-containing protein [Acidimicrobiia bacterium]